MNYPLLKRERFDSGEYSLVPLRAEDTLLVKEWRNEQMDILRQQKPLTEEDQRKYFNEVVAPTFSQEKPHIMLFSFLHKGECIGYGGLVYIDWISRRAEVSFLLDTKRVEDFFEQEFGVYLGLIKTVAFERLGLNRLYTETFETRAGVVPTLERSGFIPEGRLRKHVYKNGAFIDSLMHGLLKSEAV